MQGPGPGDKYDSPAAAGSWRGRWCEGFALNPWGVTDPSVGVGRGAQRGEQGAPSGELRAPDALPSASLLCSPGEETPNPSHVVLPELRGKTRHSEIPAVPLKGRGPPSTT